MAVKICIVGCGALGSAIGAHLARLQEVEVHAYDVSEAHIKAIRERGLKISGSVEFTVRLHATTRASEIPPCDFGIFATKSIHTRAAVEQSAHIFWRIGGSVLFAEWPGKRGDHCRTSPVCDSRGDRNGRSCAGTRACGTRVPQWGVDWAV